MLPNSLRKRQFTIINDAKWALFQQKLIDLEIIHREEENKCQIRSESEIDKNDQTEDNYESKETRIHQHLLSG